MKRHFGAVGASIKSVLNVPSGFAISLTTPTASKQLLERAPEVTRIFGRDYTLEIDRLSEVFRIPYIPQKYTVYEADKTTVATTDPEAVADAVEEATGTRPLGCRPLLNKTPNGDAQP